MEVYYKTDTHWNRLAAFRVYQGMIKRFAKKFPNVGEPLRVDDFEVSIINEGSGDLSGIMNANEFMQRTVYHFIPKSHKLSGMAKNGEKMKGENGYIYYNSDQLEEKPRMLMYRDSYTQYLHPYLSEHFSFNSYAWTREFNMERVDQDKPDIVVYEMMERFMDEMLNF